MVVAPNEDESAARGTRISYWWGCTVVQPLRRTTWQFLTKLNLHRLTYGPEISLHTVYPGQVTPYVFSQRLVKEY